MAVLHRSPGKGLGFKPTWLQNNAIINQYSHALVPLTPNVCDTNRSDNPTIFIGLQEDGTSGFPTAAGLKQVTTGLIA